MTVLPNFLVVGAQHAGSSRLRTILASHPQVLLPEREGEVFTSACQNDPAEAYSSMYTSWCGQPWVGDHTAAYMLWSCHPARTAARIAETLPDARIIAALTDPVDRMAAAFEHHRRRGRVPPDRGLLDHVTRVPPSQDHLSVVSGSWYGESLAPFRARFGDGLLVLTDDADERTLARRAFAHIGADPVFVPPLPPRRPTPGVGEDVRERLASFVDVDGPQLESVLGGPSPWHA